MNYPFAHLPFHRQRFFFGILLLLTLLVMGILAWMERPLAKAGASIVDFELAGTLDKAQTIMHGWGEANRQLARQQTVVDFVFLVLYPLAIALGCGLAARQFSTGSWSVTVGLYLAWAQLAAGLLDAVEHVVLLRLLQGAQHPSLPLIARWCALPKFAIVGVGFIYVLIGASTWAFHAWKINQGRQSTAHPIRLRQPDHRLKILVGGEKDQVVA